MKTLLGLVLTLVGGAVVLVGFGYAVLALAGMYQGALSDAMADGHEQEVAAKMWRGAMIGLAGLPLFVVGNFMLGRGLLARLRGKK